MQLYELERSRALISQYEEILKKINEADAKYKDAVEQEKSLLLQKISLAENARDLAIERAELYKNMYNTMCGNGRSAKCTILRILTIGIYRCK